jgi:hypothetical protein
LATMSQKSSFPHPTDSVQYVLTSNSGSTKVGVRRMWPLYPPWCVPPRDFFLKGTGSTPARREKGN